MNQGLAKVNFFYTYDTFDHMIPSKDEGAEINRTFISLRKEMNKYQKKQERLGIKEKNHLLKFDKVEKRIYTATMIEIGVIVFAFVFEYIMLNHYLKNKELI